MEGAADGRESAAPAASGRFGGLRTRLVVLVLAAVLPAFVILAQDAAREREAILEGAAEDAQRQARIAAARGREILAAAKPYVELLARSDVVRGTDRVAQDRLFAELVAAAEDRIRNIGLIALDGSVLASAVEQPAGLNLKERAYFQRAVETGRTALGTYQIGKIHFEPSINLGTPVRGPTDEVVAVVFVALRLDWAKRSGHSVDDPDGSAMTLVGPDGTILAHDPEASGLTKSVLPEAPLVRAMKRDSEHRERIVGLDGVVRSWGWVPIEYEGRETGGVLAVGLSTAAAEALAAAELRGNLLALGIAAALALGVAWLVGDILVVRRARRLVEVTGRIAAGDLGARVGGAPGGGEIGAVARSVDAMAGALERREAELRRAEARYRSLVEQTPAVFYVTGVDPGERTVQAGPEVRALFGFDASAWRTDPRLWAERLDPEDRERVLGELRRVAASPGSFTLEYRLLGRDGAAAWVSDTGTARRDGDAVHITGFLVDVTEVKTLHERRLESGQLDAAARVASGVARDVEDLASAVERHARAVLPKVEGDAVQRGHVEGILRAIERAASLAADLRAFGGAQRLTPEPVTVNPAIERLLPEIRHGAGPSVEVKTLLAPGVRPAWVDRAGLDQAILRLAAHVARGLREDRRRAGGKLTIGTLDVKLDEAAARRSGVAAGSYVLVAFGEGAVAPGAEVAARTFQPFGEPEAPAAPGPGRRDAGLVLASVFGFARQSGGTAEVAGEPGRPSAWRLLLPCPA